MFEGTDRPVAPYFDLEEQMLRDVADIRHHIKLLRAML